MLAGNQVDLGSSPGSASIPCASIMGPIVLLYLSVPDCRVGCRAALCGSRRSPKQARHTAVLIFMEVTKAGLANQCWF